jgi:predicted nucleic acid-binding Zn ribbon protein
MKGDERPEDVRRVLQRVLEQSGLAGRLRQARVVEQWPELVGSYIGAATRAESMAADGVLVVSVKSSAWMTELSLLEREILQAINRATPDEPIVRIHWQLMR